ncbi:MAG: cytidylate kinase-like family protein [Clostridiales bacterium]|nr:cytidylate kinase-like family protein [Clostridiales bacterium]
MSNPLIITIGREYGSGGHQIGEIVAKKLGIAFYDKQIISLAAQKSGLSDEFIANNEQRVKSGLMQNLAASAAYSSGFFSSQYLPLSESIFISQAQVIRDIAAKESAVIVGRCADYVLAGRQNTINVFIHAPKEARVQRIMALYHLDEAAALKAIATSDKERGNHYFRYTDLKWGKAQNYDISINSALMGIEKTAEMLISLANIEERA